MQRCGTFCSVAWYPFRCRKLCKPDGRHTRARLCFSQSQQFPFPTVIGCCIDFFLSAPRPHGQAAAAAVLYSCRPLLQLRTVFQLCACHSLTSNMTVTERFATSRYYCLMPVYARGGLTLTPPTSSICASARMSVRSGVRSICRRKNCLRWFLRRKSIFRVSKRAARTQVWRHACELQMHFTFPSTRC